MAFVPAKEMESPTLPKKRQDTMFGAVRQRVKSACATTSVKAIPRAVKAETRGIRLMWMAFATVLVSVALWQTIDLILEYRQYPTVTVFTELTLFDAAEKTAEIIAEVFPATTFCNLYPFRRNVTFRGVVSFDDYVKIIYREINSAQFNETRKAELVDHLHSSKGYFQNIKLEDAYELGHQVDSFILSCRFIVDPFHKEIPCAEMAAIRTFLTPDYFTCYTLEINQTHLREAPVFLRGLTMVLNTNSWDSVTKPLVDRQGQEMGALVTINEQRRVADIKHDSYRLAVGQHTIIKVEGKIRTRLGPPHGICTNDARFQTWDNQTYKHSVESCIGRCLGRISLDECGCWDVNWLPIAPVEFLAYPFCGRFPENGALDELTSRFICSEVTQSKALKECIANCAVSCREIVYSDTVTATRWPSPDSLDAVYESYLKRQPNIFKGFKTGKLADEDRSHSRSGNDSHPDVNAFIENNLVKVTIMGKGSTVGSVEDVAKWTINSILASTGATLNLWAGITMVLIVELLELSINLCRLTRRQPADV